MKHCKRVSHNIEMHSRELFEKLELPDYNEVRDLKASIAEKNRGDGSGYYFYLNLAFTTEIEEETEETTDGS